MPVVDPGGLWSRLRRAWLEGAPPPAPARPAADSACLAGRRPPALQPLLAPWLI